MDISKSGNVVTITGNIKTVADYQTLKTAVDMVAEGNNDILIRIKDSISITSSIIGYFNKLILKDKINIEMIIGNAQLMELLEDLSLVSLFNARKG
jgi:hypothetical protein